MQGNGHPRIADTTEYVPPPIRKHTLRELRERFPELQPPVIEGLLREGETCNVIAAPKVGKSWLVYYVSLSVIMGWSLFSRFCTSQGKVLIIDNELHPETLASRVPVVAEAMGVDPFGGNDGYLDELELWPLRGDLRSLNELMYEFETIERGDFKLIIFDAKYRFATEGQSENDNASEARFYNQVDRIADQTGAAIMLVHHSSKGNQAGKSVTDVGAGAGAQSRAADCHLVLREHEEPGHIVLDAVVRSFAPPSPLVLRWEWPLWNPVDGMDPEKLAGSKSKQQEELDQRDHQGKLDILTVLRRGPQSARKIRSEVGMGPDRLGRLLFQLVEEGHIIESTTTKNGKECTVYTIQE
ncbi:AAA family ATPase [Aeoliella sp.]|uniref:AAA family ATPase n=1 Tax=Aeoliella sp. TaxID=2795800 RepID=UPI003CCB8A71